VLDVTAVPAQVLGQDRLGHLFREANVESVTAAAGREIDLTEQPAFGVELDLPLLDAGGEEGLEDAE
jgi:hypothetical protein